MNVPTAKTSLPHLDHLDGWRGLAIGVLLIGHFFPVPGINLGAVGVNLFFVLSGLLMGQLLFVKQVPIATFYKRRISRIVPAHVFFIASVTGFYFVSGQPISWRETFAALFFVNNYITGEPGRDLMPFGHIWSLSVEEHSYIVLSMIAIAARQKWLGAKWTIASLALLFSFMGFWYWSHYSGKEFDFGKRLHSEVSAYGIFVSAWLLLLVGKMTLKIPSLVFPALLAAGLMMHWWIVPQPLRITVGVGLFALIVNLLPNAPQAIKAALSIRPLRYLGLWSFSIYLWQQPFYLAMHKGIIPSYWAIVLAIAFGVASYYLLENPARSYLNRVWGKSP